VYGTLLDMYSTMVRVLYLIGHVNCIVQWDVYSS